MSKEKREKIIEKLSQSPVVAQLALTIFKLEQYNHSCASAKEALEQRVGSPWFDIKNAMLEVPGVKKG